MSHTRLIAFYLPQFHPTPENDEWWGTGFTEWRNVVKARPLFAGHYQPHLPADLGFYDLRVPEVREQQAALAREYGVYGFCYYHYWFHGRRVLQRPFAEVLESGRPDFPFCLCWANENWTRVWDGGERALLLEQRYSAEDDRSHIRSLIAAFRDRRYIRIDGRPLFLVYRTEALPDPARTAEIWREECTRAGVGDPYLARVERFVGGVDPATIGFDAAVEFAPEGGGAPMFRGAMPRVLSKLGLFPRCFQENYVAKYDHVVAGMRRKPAAAYTRFRCVSPSWDNTPRRRTGARVLIDATPDKYGVWLRETLRETARTSRGDRRIVFVNAWNEWAEGCHLEPDLRWGRAYLEATRRAVAEAATDHTAGCGESAAVEPAKVPEWKRAVWTGRAALAQHAEFLRTLVGRVE